MILQKKQSTHIFLENQEMFEKKILKSDKKIELKMKIL